MCVSSKSNSKFSNINLICNKQEWTCCCFFVVVVVVVEKENHYSFIMQPFFCSRSLFTLCWCCCCWFSLQLINKKKKKKTIHVVSFCFSCFLLNANFSRALFFWFLFFYFLLLVCVRYHLNHHRSTGNMYVWRRRFARYSSRV